MTEAEMRRVLVVTILALAAPAAGAEPLPVALGLPALLAATFLPWRRLRRRRP